MAPSGSFQMAKARNLYAQSSNHPAGLSRMLPAAQSARYRKCEINHSRCVPPSRKVQPKLRTLGQILRAPDIDHLPACLQHFIVCCADASQGGMKLVSHAKVVPRWSFACVVGAESVDETASPPARPPSRHPRATPGSPPSRHRVGSTAITGPADRRPSSTATPRCSLRCVNTHRATAVHRFHSRPRLP